MDGGNAKLVAEHALQQAGHADAEFKLAERGALQLFIFPPSVRTRKETVEKCAHGKVFSGRPCV